MNKSKVKAGKPIHWIVIGGFLCGLYVILGAFGAHGLEPHLSEKELNTYHTGLRYVIVHGLGLMVVNTVYIVLNRYQGWTNWLMVAGLLFFSASLLIHSTRHLMGLSIDAFAMLAPIGGLSFVAAWFVFSIHLLRK